MSKIDWPVAITITGLLMWAGLMPYLNDPVRKCKGAGYEAAALEKCEIRVKAGGPVYEENVGYTHNPPKENP